MPKPQCIFFKIKEKDLAAPGVLKGQEALRKHVVAVGNYGGRQELLSFPIALPEQLEDPRINLLYPFSCSRYVRTCSRLVWLCMICRQGTSQSTFPGD